MLLSVSSIIYDMILSSNCTQRACCRGLLLQAKWQKKEKGEEREEVKQLPPGPLRRSHFGTEQFSFHPRVRTAAWPKKESQPSNKGLFAPSREETSRTLTYRGSCKQNYPALLSGLSPVVSFSFLLFPSCWGLSWFLTFFSLFLVAHWGPSFSSFSLAFGKLQSISKEG